MTIYRLINEQVKQRCIEEIESFYQPMEVHIKKPGRSNPQNSYFHKLVSIIADHTGDDLEDVKLRIKYECLPLREITVKGIKHLYPVSTTELTKADFVTLIDKTLFIGHQLGLVLPLASHYGLEAA